MVRNDAITIETLADFRTHGMRVFLTCAEGIYCHQAELDLDAMIARFGSGQSFYDDRLQASFRCRRCGRRGQAQITIIPDHRAANERAVAAWMAITADA